MTPRPSSTLVWWQHDPVDQVRLAAQPSVAERLAADAQGWLDVSAWDGQGDPPGPVDFWVVPYQAGMGLDATAALARVPDVRVVQLLSAGVEPWPSLVPPGVQLCGGRGIHGPSTAELAIALLLGLVRDLPRYGEQQRRAAWVRHPARTLARRRVAVLGAGDVGGRIAGSLGALGAEPIRFGRTAHGEVRDAADLPDALPAVDALVVALPLTERTRGLVDAGLLNRLPDGAVVVNVGRGAVVRTDDLTAEVASGRLRAGLDVVDPEPLPPEHPLWSLPGVLITPHVGGGAEGWLEAGVDLVREQVGRWHDGRQLLNLVNAGY